MKRITQEQLEKMYGLLESMAVMLEDGWIENVDPDDVFDWINEYKDLKREIGE